MVPIETKSMSKPKTDTMPIDKKRFSEQRRRKDVGFEQFADVRPGGRAFRNSRSVQPVSFCLLLSFTNTSVADRTFP